MANTTNKPQRFIWVAFLLLLLGGSTLLYCTLPLSTRISAWGPTVLRNWHDFGFFQLHGKLVYNPGGGGLPDHPIVYGGHRALSLYPAYLASHLPGKEGLAYFLCLSLAIGLGVWRLLGGGLTGMTAAVLTVFTPCFVDTLPTLDTLDIPVLLSIPFLCWIRDLLAPEKISFRALVLLLVLVAAYAPLNWTTILGFGIVMAYLAAALPGKFRRVILFACITGVAGALVLAISLIDKAGDSHHAMRTEQFSKLFNNYLWGAEGYGGQNPMTTGKAFSRLAIIGVISLLPLWIFFIRLAVRTLRQTKNPMASLFKPSWPLLAASGLVGGLRNYFAHHPWMAGPVFICGIVFSCRLLLDQAPPVAPAESEKGTFRAALSWAWPAVLGLAYSLGILLCLRVNTASVDALVRLTGHTDRQAVIYFSPQTDPWLAANTKRLDLLDRVIKPLPEGNLPTKTADQFLLTSQTSPAYGTALASTQSEPDFFSPFVARLLDWYRVHVAKRAPGDRIEVNQVLFLYPLP